MLNKSYDILPNGAKIFRGAVISLVTIPLNSTVRREVKKDLKDTVIGENTVVYPGAVIYAGVEIGKNCLIGCNVVIRDGCKIGDNVLLANNTTLNYDVTIGNRVKVMDNTHITGGMILEDDVFISICVTTSNDNTMGKHEGKYRCNPPIIRQGAVIGAGANILPSIVIGKNARVAAGAVVTHDVPPNTTVMGIPARVVE